MGVSKAFRKSAFLAIAWSYGMFAMFSLLFDRGGNVALKALQKSVRFRFPDVPQIHPDDLIDWFSDANRNNPLLLDVRSKHEYLFSHLPGAVQVDPNIGAGEFGNIIGNASTVVVYCSVGYRSSQLAARLSGSVGAEVFNLEGSIFAWANAGYPLLKGGAPCKKVHPYSRAAGKMLRKEARGIV
jgi:rhodanese-related sulfurtransferase